MSAAPSPAVAPPPGNPRFPLFDSLRAIAALKESTLAEPVKALSQKDSNLKVREAALETLKAVG